MTRAATVSIQASSGIGSPPAVAFGSSSNLLANFVSRTLIGSNEIAVRIKTAKREWIANPGEDIVIPRGAGHTWGNPFEEPAHVVVELRPALRAETYFETYFALARDGRVNPKTGLPSLLQFALMLHEYRNEFAAPPPFGALGAVATALLSPIARARDYRARYGNYEDPNGP
jgi:hypothetical protein